MVGTPTHVPTFPEDPSVNTTPTLVAELLVLHDSYVGAINSAVADDDEGRVAELAASYEREAALLVQHRSAA